MRKAATRTAILAPCVFYLFIEFARPVAYLPILEPLRLGMWASFWGFATLMTGGSFRLTRPVRLMLCFLALMALQVALAKNNRFAFNSFWGCSILMLGSVVPIGVLPRTVSEVRFLVVAYFALHFFTAVHGIFHKGVGLSGWMQDENDLAFAILAALGVGLYVFFATTGTGNKLLVGLMIALSFGCIISTNSRGGFLGLLGQIAYLIGMGPQRKKIVGIVVLTAVLGLLFIPASYWQDMQTIETSTNKDDTGYERIVSWNIAWRIFKDHPVLGVGSSNFPVYAGEYGDAMRGEMFIPRHFWGRAAHSLYFTLLSEQGSVGVIIFVLLLIWYFRAGRRIRRRAGTLDSVEERRWVSSLASGLDAGMIGALGSGAFITVIYYPVIWVLIGLMAALDRVVPEGVAVSASVLATSRNPGRRGIGAVAVPQR